MSYEEQTGTAGVPSSDETQSDGSPFERFKAREPETQPLQPSSDHEPPPELDENEKADLARLTSLDPAVLNLWREYPVLAALTGLVVGGGALLLREIDAPGWIWVGVGAIGALFVVLAIVYFATIPIQYRQWRWSLDTQRLYVEKGVFIHSTMLVPRNRIQNVTTEAGPLKRRHGLTTLTVHTAGMRSPNVDIPALNDEVARLIRTELGHQ